MSDMTWPDTAGQDPPADHLYLSATWLLGVPESRTKDKE